MTNRQQNDADHADYRETPKDPAKDDPYVAFAWDFAYAVGRHGRVAKGPQFHSLAAAQAEADRLNELIREGKLR